MNDLPGYFSDPFDPPRSLQLNNRYWPNEGYQHLDMLREAEYDVNNSRLVSLRKTIKRVTALLPANVRRAFLSRLVYSMMYQVSFQPIRFSLTLSDDFVRANSYRGSESEVYLSAQRTKELKYIVDLAHSIYRDHYGADVLSSAFEVRYVNSRNTKAVERMTAYGEFSDFHFDQGKDFTCIIYLCPVGHDNGCFTYVDGSPLIRKSHLLRALHQVVEFDMGLSTPEEKSHLPLEFRGSMAIGNYLDQAKADRLRSACVDVVGSVGDGIIFNGFDTLHRGGKPLTGERTAVFISTKGYVNKRVKKAAYDQLAYLWL